MSKFERVREAMSSPPTSDYVRERADEGWRLVAVEWARPVDVGSDDAGLLKEERVGKVPNDNHCCVGIDG